MKIKKQKLNIDDGGVQDNTLTEDSCKYVSEDESLDYNMYPEKQPAISTYQTELRNLCQNLNKNIHLYIIQYFDRLKIILPLKYDIQTNFQLNEDEMFWCDNPEIRPSKKSRK